MSETCETCRFWLASSASDWEFDALGVGDCQAIKMRSDIKDEAFEHRPRKDFDDWDEVEKLEVEALRAAKAFAVDGSGYYAALRTFPDFGCVLHQRKETQNDDRGKGAGLGE